ncbi:MAG: hypothetical protein ACLP50_27715 [Solirubrobacteraceae bacterium]
MTTVAPPRSRSSLLELPQIREVHAPRWFARLPRWAGAGGVLVLLLAISAVLRTRQLSGQLWFNEAIAVGMASHALSALPGVLRAGGSSPLYYVLLHFWIDGFGSSEAATHTLSVLIGLATVPVAMWTGWTLGGRRAGLFAATLFAFSSFLTQYAEETQPYELMALLGLLATAGFLLGFAHRRRRFLWLFAIALALMLYTQAAAALFGFGALAALVLVWRLAETAPERRGILRDGLICFGGALIVYLPSLPATIHQILHATSPWRYGPLLGATVPGTLMGGDRVDVTLLVAAIVGVMPLLAPGRRRTPEAVAIWSLIALPVAALMLARASTIIAPGWAYRYFAPLVPSLLLLGALTAARARLVGVAAIVLCMAFLANPASFAPAHKSDMLDVAGELGPRLRAGDLVVVAQPEQTPLVWYYLPSGLQWADTIGRVRDPSTIVWTDALARLRTANPQKTLGSLIASLNPGQRLLYVRPLTEGEQNWAEPWTQLVRRRSAQWGQVLDDDVANGTLTPLDWAPHNYRSACCVADSAVLYRKAS